MTDIFDELDQAVGMAPDPDVPDNAVSAAEYARQKDISRHKARYRLQEAYARGDLEAKKTHWPASDGRLICQWVYWVPEEER